MFQRYNEWLILGIVPQLKSLPSKAEIQWLAKEMLPIRIVVCARHSALYSKCSPGMRARYSHPVHPSRSLFASMRSAVRVVRFG